MRILKKLLLSAALILFFIFTLLPKTNAAVLLSIETPSEELVRDQEYDFLVTIDTFNEAIANLKGNMSYESQYLELVSVSNGNFFSTISHTTPTVGTIELSGSNTAPKSGSGTFAIVRFKLIATAPGSTTLCTVTPVYDIPTPSPTTPLSCGRTPCDDTTNPCGDGMVCIKSGTNSICAMSQYQVSCTANMTTANCCQAPTCGKTPCDDTTNPCGTGMVCVKSGTNSICAMSQYQAQCAASMTQANCCQAAIVPLPTNIPTAGMSLGWKIGSFVALGFIGVGVLGMLLL